MVRQIQLTESNSQKVDELSRQTGKTPDTLINEAISQFEPGEETADEQIKFQQWREALLGIEGMWADRDDLPDFEQLRKTWDRNLWEK
jgi:predicted transcriptional regulator